MSECGFLKIAVIDVQVHTLTLTRAPLEWTNLYLLSFRAHELLSLSPSLFCSKPPTTFSHFHFHFSLVTGVFENIFQFSIIKMVQISNCNLFSIDTAGIH